VCGPSGVVYVGLTRILKRVHFDETMGGLNVTIMHLAPQREG
jgi:hypothetical protein